jgi:hypothetical protein
MGYTIWVNSFDDPISARPPQHHHQKKDARRDKRPQSGTLRVSITNFAGLRDLNCGAHCGKRNPI